MKKDRNCGGNYPVYSNMPMQMGPMQGMPMPTYGGMPMPMPMVGPMQGMQTEISSNYSNVESQINNLNNQINALEQRVSSLESLVNKGFSNNYNTSNYQMM